MCDVLVATSVLRDLALAAAGLVLAGFSPRTRPELAVPFAAREACQCECRVVAQEPLLGWSWLLGGLVALLVLVFAFGVALGWCCGRTLVRHRIEAAPAPVPRRGQVLYGA